MTAATNSTHNQPESYDLRRLVTLVERMFQVPVAFLAMPGRQDRGMTRIGSGEPYWDTLKTYPLFPPVTSPLALRDTAVASPREVDFGSLRFVAAVPLYAHGGQHLGVLMIADLVPQPEFSDSDLQTLVELGAVLVNALEMRLVASQANRSQLQLRENEERFQYVANTAASLIACCSANGACAFVNRAWLAFTGRGMADEKGEGWLQSLHPQNRESVLQAYRRACQSRRPFQVDAPMRRHDGVFRWMRFDGTPRVLEDGSSAGFLVCLTDMTGARDAATEYHKETQCLAALAEATRAQYVVFDHEGWIERASPGFAKAAGAPADNVRGRMIGNILPNLQGAIGAVLDTRACASAAIDSGQWTVTPIRSQRGALCSLLAVLAEPAEAR